jgi:hypothetical protein
LAAALAQESASASLPLALVASTMQAATAYAAGSAAAATVVSATVAALTEGVVRTMVLSKFEIGVLLLVVLGVAAAAAASVSFGARANDQLAAQTGQQVAQQADNDKGTGRPALAKPSETGSPAKDHKVENQQYETWRMGMSLQASKRLPSAVQWAIFDHDPVPAFVARIKELRWLYREQLRAAKNEAAREEIRKGWITVQWDSGFKEIRGDRLYLLQSDQPHPLTSNGPDGKKWIVTKVRMTKGKPVCWCMPVDLKYGEEIKVTLTDKNVFDLGSAADRALRAAATLPGENKKFEEVLRTTWRLRLNLRVPGSAPFEVSYAIFDEDPVPRFKASVKKWQANRKGERVEKEEVKGEARQAAMAANWDGLFKKIAGNRVYQLKSSGSPVLASNEPDGRKWIVTKVVQIKGKSVCWGLPVKVKTGQGTAVTLTEDNAFDLGSVFDRALREAGARQE